MPPPCGEDLPRLAERLKEIPGLVSFDLSKLNL